MYNASLLTTPLSPMNREIQEYYEAAFTMFSSKGWKDLLEDLNKLRDTYNDISQVQDVNTLYLRKGQLDILDLILQRKQSCEAIYKDLEENNA